MRRTIVSLAVGLLIFFAVATQQVSTGVTAFSWQEIIEKPPLPTATPEEADTPQRAPELLRSPEDQAIQQAFLDRVHLAESQENILALMIYEPVINSIHHSQDGSTALLWVGLTDPETGELVATEPSLSIARSQDGMDRSSSAAWSVMLPTDTEWGAAFQSLPPDLLTEDLRMRYLETGEASANATAALPFKGYKLPWAAGLEKRVTNSIGHYLTVSGGLTSCPATCQYAFDFADGTMFPLLASKGGTVKAAKWSCANGTESCTNYLILEDQSTSPTTYQVYYHLAYNSIPIRLRSIGAPVVQGEYIGNVDDTGYSTGHHLHFHVYTTPSSTTSWSWGRSVDFTYDDVTDNGGRPRTCAESSQYPNLGAQCQKYNRYKSGNIGAKPPTATLSTPANRQQVTSRTMTVSGTASDDIRVQRIQVMVNYNGSWQGIADISPTGNGPYSQEVDLCAAGKEVPDGPFAMTVSVYDYEGSLASGIPVRHLIKNFTCGSSEPPPPTCTPSANQVALYDAPDFRGTCVKFDASSSGYLANNLGALGDNKASSVQVGSGVRAILFDWDGDIKSGVQIGRIETLEANDASLADNRLGSDRVSGLIVQPRSTSPDEPFFNQPIGSSLTGAKPTNVDSIVLSWEGGAGATSFEVRLTGPVNITKTTTTNSLSIGSLPAGSYSLTVTAKNSAGSNGTSTSFTVGSAALPSASAVSVPFTADMEAGPGSWAASGLWRHGSVTVGSRGATKAWIFNDGTDYENNSWRAGDLTSPPINIPASGKYYLRFNYFMNVEDGKSYWDQRRVQVSVNGGAFTDLHQQFDDKQGSQVWLNSGPISLANYAGKTIRLRFHFNTVDEENNGGQGWMIDDVTIDTRAPNTSCADTNNQPGAAASVGVNSITSGVICPEQDVDYFVFNGTAGQSLLVDIDARTLSPASKLDTSIYLLSEDGVSIIAENDDEQYNVLFDSLLSYSLNRTGKYYVKVKAWNHPGVGSPEHFYKLKLSAVSTPLSPSSVQILYPTSKDAIPQDPFEISVAAKDFDGGSVAKVEFYWHSSDWNKTDWVKLASDVDGSDGWSTILDPLAYGSVKGAALYVQAVSRTGGARGIVWWDLSSESNVPSSTLAVLPEAAGSTAFQLNWQAFDANNDLSHFELQYREGDGGAWQNWPGNPIGAGVRSLWFVGKPGIKYGLRMRAVDRAGNVEAYPDQAETSTAVEAACMPDASEAINTLPSNSIPLVRDETSGQYNLCSSSQPGAGGGDVDWVSIQAKAGEQLMVVLQSTGGGASFNANLYASPDASAQPLYTWKSRDFGKNQGGVWTVPEDKTYYLKVEAFRADLFGTNVTYQVWQGTPRSVYLPGLFR